MVAASRDAVVRADEVDLDDPAVLVEVVSRGVVPVAADGAGRPPDAGAVHQGLQRCHLDRRFDGGDDVLGVGHVGRREDAADLLGQLGALVLLQVGHDDADAPFRQGPGGRRPQSRSPAGDDRRRAVQIHQFFDSFMRPTPGCRIGPTWAFELCRPEDRACPRASNSRSRDVHSTGRRRPTAALTSGPAPPCRAARVPGRAPGPSGRRAPGATSAPPRRRPGPGRPRRRW